MCIGKSVWGTHYLNYHRIVL